MKNLTLPSVLWLLAFLSSLFLINAWQLQFFAAAFLLVCGASILSLRQNAMSGWSIPKSPVIYLMGAFWLLAFISTLHSEVFNTSLMAFCFFSVMPLGFFLFYNQVDLKQFSGIAKIAAIIFAGLSIWALAQFFVFGEYYQGRARHPLMNANSLAALFNLGFFCALGWMIVAKEKLHANMALILSILIFGGIMATGSRGALFSMLPFLLIFLFLMRGQVAQHKKCLGILGLACLVLFALTLLGNVENNNLVNRVVETTNVSMVEASSNRFTLWAATIEMIKAHGLWGTGIGTYSLYFPEFRLAEDIKGAYYAHNDPLQYWVELGVLGPVLFYALMIAVLIRTVRALKVAGITVIQRTMIVAPFCALGAVVLHTHVTFNFYNLSILCAVGFLLALWFNATQVILKTPARPVAFPPKATKATRMVCILLPFLMIAGIFSAYMASEYLTGKASKNLFAGEFETFADQIILAQDISFGGNDRPYLLAVNVPLSLLQEDRGRFTDAQRQEIFDQGLSYVQHVVRINPRSASGFYYLGKIQEIAPKMSVPEDVQTPEFYYRKAMDLDPLHIGARVTLAQIMTSRGDDAAALEVLQDGYKYRYNTIQAMDLYTALLRAYDKVGDRTQEPEILEKMNKHQRYLDRTKFKQDRTPLEYMKERQ